MTRRRAGMTLLAGAAKSSAETAAPGDIDRLNALAGHYNRYVERLKEGVIDVKMWGRVQRAWDALR